MNLVSHFACAEPAGFGVRLGAVLPDLLSLYGRKVRPLPLVRYWGPRADELEGADALIRGVLFHHEVDRHFHRAPLFLGASAALQSRLLRASRTPGLKRFLPAHVLTELFLDHLLVRRDGALLHAFGETLDRGQGMLEAFIAEHPAVDAEAFRRFLGRIATDRFWEDYRHPAGIFYRMNRILARFSQRTLEPAEERAVAGYFESRAEAIEAELDAFVAEMRSRLAEPAAAPRRRRAGSEGAAGDPEPRTAVNASDGQRSKG